jgi:hypothetical protein
VTLKIFAFSLLSNLLGFPAVISPAYSESLNNIPKAATALENLKLSENSSNATWVSLTNTSISLLVSPVVSFLFN